MWVPRALPKPPLASDEPLGLWWLMVSVPTDRLVGSILMKEPQLESRGLLSVGLQFSSLL